MPKIIDLTTASFLNASPVSITETALEVTVGKEGGSIIIPVSDLKGHHCLAAEIKTLDSPFRPFFIRFFKKGQSAESEGCFSGKTGVKPGLLSTWTFELGLLKGGLVPKRTPGRQKLDLSGREVLPEDIDRISFQFIPATADIHVRFSDLRLCDQAPDYVKPDTPIIDEMGQYIPKDWPGKTRSVEEMTENMNRMYQESLAADGAFPSENWNRWGGWKDHKLTEGTGFFGTFHDGKRWWLTDPDGCAFISVGMDCVGGDRNTRYDSYEHLLKWIPSKEEYPEMVREEYAAWQDCTAKSVDFPAINLKRAFGDDWQKKWTEMSAKRLRNWGFNTVGNWTDDAFCQASDLPYVLPLDCKSWFPTTKARIYRDFPDVFSEEYQTEAERFSQCLIPYREDPFLIGYFMCNEPHFGFEKDLNLGLELLLNPEPLASRRQLVDFLEKRYENDIHRLNESWETAFPSFAALRDPKTPCQKPSAAGEAVLDEFTAVLISEYVGAPARACRKVDPNHLNLGMRWAFIHDPKLVAGWEYFDVFSINCYKIDPRPSILAIADAGVKKPVMIGEFHSGALDAGNSATGIRGVASQEERGKAFRYYVENAASLSILVGCHHFTFNDQSALGRFDGECYNIGFVDVCQKPYPAMVKGAQQAAKNLYAIACGEKEPTTDCPEEIPAVFL